MKMEQQITIQDPTSQSTNNSKYHTKYEKSNV